MEAPEMHSFPPSTCRQLEAIVNKINSEELNRNVFCTYDDIAVAVTGLANDFAFCDGETISFQYVQEGGHVLLPPVSGISCSVLVDKAFSLFKTLFCSFIINNGTLFAYLLTADHVH